MGCRDRELLEPSNFYYTVRVTLSERAEWNRRSAELGISTAEMLRSALNRFVGFEPRRRAAPVQPKRRPAPVVSGVHCSFSGLPRTECLCPLCSKKEG